MGRFLAPLDIGKRALQHCGARLSITSFADDSKEAVEISTCYDKLRRAELRSSTWRFATRKALLRPIGANTMLLVPEQWSASVMYTNGAIVDDGSGAFWTTAEPVNQGQQPGLAGVYSWVPYIGPLTVEKYDHTIGYYDGELVYETSGNGNIYVYSSRESNNSDDPSVGTAWSATASYSKGQVVISAAGFYFMSMFDGNLNNAPAAHDPWNVNTTYALDAQVYSFTDGMLYQSSTAANTGNDPTLDTTGAHWIPLGLKNPWTCSFVESTGSINWVRINAPIKQLNIDYPIGSGPVQNSATRNAFHLPANYLRPAPQDPKAGAVSFLGAPSGLSYDDWTYEGDYFTSRTATPIIYRFVADMQAVWQMDDLFCEALGARIGMEISEPLTQSGAKLTMASNAYKRFMDDAKRTNGIEIGAIQPPEDDYITCRL